MFHIYKNKLFKINKLKKKKKKKLFKNKKIKKKKKKEIQNFLNVKIFNQRILI